MSMLTGFQNTVGSYAKTQISGAYGYDIAQRNIQATANNTRDERKYLQDNMINKYRSDQAMFRDRGLTAANLQNNQLRALQSMGRDQGIVMDRENQRRSHAQREAQHLGYLNVREIGRTTRHGAFERKRTSRYANALNDLIENQRIKSKHSIASGLMSGQTSADRFWGKDVTADLLAQTSKISAENWQPQDSVNDLETAMNVAQGQNMASIVSAFSNNPAFTPTALSYGAAFNNYTRTRPLARQNYMNADFNVSKEAAADRKMLTNQAASAEKIALAKINTANTTTTSVKNSDVTQYGDKVLVYTPMSAWSSGTIQTHQTDDTGWKGGNKAEAYEWNGKYYDKQGFALPYYALQRTTDDSGYSISFTLQTETQFKKDYAEQNSGSSSSTTTTTNSEGTSTTTITTS